MPKTDHTPQSPHQPARWWCERELWILVLLVVCVYFTRLSALPVRGEESRWARVAVQMIQYNDWLVPRQQGQPYLDRPPLAQWAIATVGLVRGQVDLVAIRLPSVLAVLLTSILIYGFGRTFLSPLGAFAGSIAFISAGQVLQIGRLGENEALYTLLLGGGLLLWNWGYTCRWPMVTTWCVGYSLAACGMLVKGPQAPVYFVAATGMYLLLRREWKWIFGWQHIVGLSVFGVVFSLWAVPFYIAVGHDGFVGTFTKVSAIRYKTGGLLQHLLEYPAETLVCLLPFSPLLSGLLWPPVRREFGKFPPHIQFLLVAILVTYPSVWFAAGARGRYFMPLYPCFAILIGFVLERTTLGLRGSPGRRGWELYLTVAAFFVGGGSLLVFASGVLGTEALSPMAQPLGMTLLFAVSGLVVITILLKARVSTDPRMTKAAILALACFSGLTFTGVVTNTWQRNSNDMSQTIAEVKSRLPAPDEMVSFGVIDHRFAYYYEDSIREYPWPLAVDDIPPGVTYFCFNRDRRDTAEVRLDGRWMNRIRTPGTLPFLWEEVAVLAHDHKRSDDPDGKTFIGRIVRPVIATNVADSEIQTR